jgi:hypothetical protein
MMDKELFSHDERQFMAHLSHLLRQSEAEGTDNEQVFLDMEAEGYRFDAIHGDGSVRSIFNRIHQAIAWKREQKELAHRCAMRALSGSKVGDLASWLNDADAALLESMGITL